MTNRQLYEKATRKWGETAQLLMLVEELNELSVEVRRRLD